MSCVYVPLGLDSTLLLIVHRAQVVRDMESGRLLLPDLT